MPQQDNCTQRYYRWESPVKKKHNYATSLRDRDNGAIALADKTRHEGYGVHYKTACHVISQALQHYDLKEAIDREKTDELRVEFLELAERWRRDTQHLSIVSKKIEHPAYFEIVGMGSAVIPLILESLRDSPAYWFVALRALAKTDPAPREANPMVARDAWIAWGKQNGYLDAVETVAL